MNIDENKRPECEAKDCHEPGFGMGFDDLINPRRYHTLCAKHYKEWRVEHKRIELKEGIEA